MPWPERELKRWLTSHTTVSFPNMPNFTLAARPLKSINVMRLPLLSEYVHKAVAEVLSSFIAPNAFTIDAARIIMVCLRFFRVKGG